MSLNIVALTCPVCGAPFTPKDEKCGYCGSILVLRTDHPKINPATLNKHVIDEHIAEYRQNLRKDPYDSAAHYGLGVAYFNLGLTDDSVRELEDAARLMPENPNIQSQLAVVLRKAHEEDRPGARQKLRDRIEYTLRLDPENVDARILKIETFDELGIDQSIDVLESIFEEDPERARRPLAELLISKSARPEFANTPEGIELLRRSYGIEPTLAERPLRRGLLDYAQHLTTSNPAEDVEDPKRSAKGMSAWNAYHGFDSRDAEQKLSRFLLGLDDLDKSAKRQIERLTTSESQPSRSGKKSKAKSQPSTTMSKSGGMIKPIIVGLLKAVGLFVLLMIATAILDDVPVISTIMAVTLLISLIALPILMPIREIKKNKIQTVDMNVDTSVPSTYTHSSQSSEPHANFSVLIGYLQKYLISRWTRQSAQRIQIDPASKGNRGERERSKIFKQAMS